jgi:hypothetical protein
VFDTILKVYSDITEGAKENHVGVLTDVGKFPLIEVLRDGLGRSDTKNRVLELLKWNNNLVNQKPMCPVEFAIRIGSDHQVVEVLLNHIDNWGDESYDYFQAAYCSESPTDMYLYNSHRKEVENQIKILMVLMRWKNIDFDNERETALFLSDILDHSIDKMFGQDQFYTIEMLKYFRSIHPCSLFSTNGTGMYPIHIASTKHPFQKELLDYLVGEYCDHVQKYGHFQYDGFVKEAERDNWNITKYIFSGQCHDCHTPLHHFLNTINDKYTEKEFVEAVGYYLKMCPGVVNIEGGSYHGSTPVSFLDDSIPAHSIGERMLRYVGVLLPKDGSFSKPTKEDISQCMEYFMKISWYHGIYLCYHVYYAHTKEAEGYYSFPAKLHQLNVPQFLSYLSSHFEVDSTFGWLKNNISEWC